MAKQSYINVELDWLEEKLKQMRAYVDNVPFETIEDRTEIVMSAKGTPVIKVIASKETIMKELRATLKDVIVMLGELNRLREIRAEAEIQLRGGGDLGGMMKDSNNSK